MSEEDNAEYRRRITEVLIRNDFGWVVAQAEAVVAEGKPTAKQVSERELLPVWADPDFRVQRPRSKRASLITSEPYTETERLEILLSAIEAALIQRSELERSVLDELPAVEAIHFEPEVATEDADRSYRGRSHQVNASRRSVIASVENEAKSALSALREQSRGSAG